ncbi:MAG: hypothetical protein QXI33_00605 [Candidatus Pacearchaeota archaeon]
MILKNKKAVIGTTLTWVVASIILVFVLVIYFIVLNLLFGVNFISQSSIMVEKGIYYNLNENKNILLFIDKNKEVVDKWVDSDLVVSREEFINGEISEEKKKLYDDLFYSYTSFAKNLDYKDPYFYIRTKEKEMKIRKSPLSNNLEFDKWSINNPTNGIFYHDIEADKIEGDPNYLNRYYFVSEGGNLILIIFYDESKIY